MKYLENLARSRNHHHKTCTPVTQKCKNVKQTPSDKNVEKARKYLKDTGLLAVPFDKGVGFNVMKKETYQKKRKDLIQAEQLIERKNLTDSVIIKIEKDINREFLDMKKKDEISEALYARLRSTGAQPARQYGLAKVHKQGTPLRRVPRPFLTW